MHNNSANVTTPIPLRTRPRPDTRTAVLDAAERLLHRLGYAKITMEDLARETGIARRTVYLHFANKEDVIFGTIDRIVERVTGRLRDIAGERSSATERLRRMLVARVMIRVDSVSGYSSALDEIFAAARGSFLLRRESYFTAEVTLFVSVLREGLKDGQLEFDNAVKTGRCLLAATNSLLPHGLTALDLTDRAKTEQTVKAIASLLLDGLRRRNGVRAVPTTVLDLQRSCQ